MNSNCLAIFFSGIIAMSVQISIEQLLSDGGFGSFMAARFNRAIYTEEKNNCLSENLS